MSDKLRSKQISFQDGECHIDTSNGVRTLRPGVRDHSDVEITDADLVDSLIQKVEDTVTDDVVINPASVFGEGDEDVSIEDLDSSPGSQLETIAISSSVTVKVKFTVEKIQYVKVYVYYEKEDSVLGGEEYKVVYI